MAFATCPMLGVLLAAGDAAALEPPDLMFGNVWILGEAFGKGKPRLSGGVWVSVEFLKN